jgi:hypothetical protein
MIRRIFTEEEVFDLELKAHGRVQFELGRSAERKRIIALIESKDEWHYAFSDVSDIIALIKGDTKK